MEEMRRVSVHIRSLVKKGLLGVLNPTNMASCHRVVYLHLTKEVAPFYRATSGFLGGLIGVITNLAAAEGILVFLDIEQNTRSTNYSVRKLRK